MKKSFESPLISHARMRAMFRALVEVRALNARLPRAHALPRLMEACWVATAIDLRDGDLTSDSAGGALLHYIRAAGLRAHAASAATARALLAAPASPFPGTTADRLLCAVGAAMALKQAPGPRTSAVVAYARTNALTAQDWSRFFKLAHPGDLPLVIVAIPAPGLLLDLNKLAARKLPVIPVDAGDAVAIYRVTQEAVVRARTLGGTVVIQAHSYGTDPIAVLAKQLVAKGICLRTWPQSVQSAFDHVIAKL